MCLSKLFGKKKVTLTGSYVLVTRNTFIEQIKTHGVIPMLDAPLDNFTHLAPKTDLDKIAKELVYPADWYINDIWDCEDYGLQAQSDAGRKFNITVRLGVGMTDLGYHGFAVTLDCVHNLWLLEPNAGFPWAGEWFKQGEYGYIANKVLI